MRIWSLHPSLLDRRALVACWRETLLAQKVLRGLTRGYTNHPQLIRFRAHPQPLEAVAAYLSGLADEADARGYSFNRALKVPAKILQTKTTPAKIAQAKTAPARRKTRTLRLCVFLFLSVSWSTSSLFCGTRWPGATPSGSTSYASVLRRLASSRHVRIRFLS